MPLSDESDLYRAIRHDDWNKAQKILREEDSNRQVDRVTLFGRNALHEACRHHDAPLELVQSLLAASATAPIAQDIDGQTPLHNSTVLSSDEIILSLIKACPQAASVVGNWGLTPLHYAIYWNRSMEVVSALLTAYPFAVMSKNKHWDTPLNYFFQKWNFGLKDVFEFVNNPSPPLDSILSLDVSDYGYTPKLTTMKDVYEKTVLLLRSAVYGTIDENSETDSFQPLHASIKLESCPLSFFNLIVGFNPKQAWQTDREGNFPLHLAAAAKPYTEIDKIRDIIDQLIALYPKAACIPNNKRILPLHLAIRSGKSFKVIKSILHAAPEALETSDSETHLLPFMLAATVTAPEVNNITIDESEKSTQQLTTIFLLLVEDPSFISLGIPARGRKRKWDDNMR